MLKGYPIATPWKTIHEDFAALVFGGYMIETEKEGTKYYQLTESGKDAGHWLHKDQIIGSDNARSN